MSFYKPIIAATTEEFLILSKTSDNFIVGPLTFSKNKLQEVFESNTDYIIMFDFPQDLIVVIDGISVVGKIFDYYNPLILFRQRINQINFYNIANKNVEHFNCLIMNSKKLHFVCLQLINKNYIHYPPDLYINYSKFIVGRGFKGSQFGDLVQKYDQTKNIDIIPSVPFDFRSFLQLLTEEQ